MIKSIKIIFKQTIEIFLSLIKIIIPIMILLEILKQIGFITVFGKFLTPFMAPIGLPGEVGIVWSTTILLNLYNGIAVFFALISSIPTMTVAQVTVLMSMCLIAHSLPVEQKILQLSGLKIIPSTLIRIGSAYLYGYLLNLTFKKLNLLQTPLKNNGLISSSKEFSWLNFSFETLKFFTLMFFIILALVTLIKLLEYFKIEQTLSFFLAKLLKPIGVNKEIMPSMMIGILLGVSYGGGLLINEIKKKKLLTLDIIKVLLFLSICHSLIEDTIIVLTTGAHYSGILLGRFIFTLGIISLLNYLTLKSTFLKDKFVSILFIKKK